MHDMTHEAHALRQPSGSRVLLLVGSGFRLYREYSLASIAHRFDVALISDVPLTWQYPYVCWEAGADFDDPADVLHAARELARQAPVEGLLTWDERFVEMCADLAGALDLPYCNPDAIRGCKDKSALRALLADEDDCAVRFAVASDLEAAQRAAQQLGYPVILKPRALAGSAGVQKISDPSELADAFDNAAGAHIGATVSAYDGVLMEEYLDGPEYSVDCLTSGGVTTPLVVAQKVLGPAPYFEEIGHFVPAADEPGLPAALEHICHVHRLAGIDRLATHTEVRLTSNGPRIIEVNVRLGGDLIPYLGLLADGVDLSLGAAQLALGEPPSVAAEHRCVAAVRFFYPPYDMTVESVGLRRPVTEYPGLDRFDVLSTPGQRFMLPPREYLSRLAWAVVTGPDIAACAERLDRVEADLVVTGEPLQVLA
jgi:biotin carboxylase